MKIASLVSLMALLVSIAQVVVAKINSDSMLAAEKIKQDRNIEFEKRRLEDDYRMEVVELVLKNKELFEKDDDAFVKKVLLSNFPVNVTSELYDNISKLKGIDDVFWLNGSSNIEDKLYPRVKLYYDDIFFEEFISMIGDTIGGGDVLYDYADQKVSKGLSAGDIRYYHDVDLEIVNKVKEDVENYFELDGFELKLNVIPLLDSPNRSPVGSIELWLALGALNNNAANSYD